MPKIRHSFIAVIGRERPNGGRAEWEGQSDACRRSDPFSRHFSDLV